MAMSADDSLESKALGIAVAGGFITAALLDLLVDKGVITTDEVRGVLQNASDSVVRFYDSDIGRNAGRAITDLFANFSK
jgi:hypothetical protein